MRYRCTKSKCRARRALPMKIEKYTKRPLCLSCGHDSLKLDVYSHRSGKTLKCTCDGVPFPHKVGTMKACKHYKGVVDCEEYRDDMDKLIRRKSGLC